MSNQITLISSDQDSFVVEEFVISQSQTIKNLIDDDCHADRISLLNVTSKTLAKEIEYCKKHAVKEYGEEPTIAEIENVKDELKKCDVEFVKIEGDDFGDVFDLLLAAHFLNIKDFLDLCCQSVADSIKDKHPEEIQKIFGIENDFTPEEEVKVVHENLWAFQ